MSFSDTINWLMEIGGPIIRYRVATELMGKISKEQQSVLRQHLLESDEVRTWLENLRAMGPVHHSMDISVENSVSKLVEYGLNADFEEVRSMLDRIYQRQVDAGESIHQSSAILFPFLVSARYTNKAIIAYYMSVLESLYNATLNFEETFAHDKDIHILLSEAEKKRQHIPKPWNTKNLMPIETAIPGCFSILMLSFAMDDSLSMCEKRQKILEFLLSPVAQQYARTKIYLWDAAARRAYSAGAFVRIHGYFGFDEQGFAPNMFLLYMSIISNYPGAKGNVWFKNGIEHLEQFKTRSGRYVFPKEYLIEQKNRYYLYSGAHMRLGEKGGNAIEIESTFRMLSIKKKAGLL